MLTQEQAETIKQRLISQIEATFPEDRREAAKEQVESMDSEQLEKFLIRNNILRSEGAEGKENCVFCSIVSGNIKSHSIAENKKALAVLEINPLARSHVIIIPKEHVGSEAEMPKEAKSLAKKVSSMIKSGLSPKTIRTEFSNLFGHEVINVIPIYDDAKPMVRNPATPEELGELQDILKKRVQKKPREKKIRVPKIKKIIKEFEENIWLPKRIP